MRSVVTPRWMWMLVPLVAGCGQNGPLFPQNSTLLGQQPSLASRDQQLQSRVTALDQDNVELESLLAQSRQRIQLLDDEMKLVREQLTTTTKQLSEARDQTASLEGRTRAMAATVRRRETATIRPNNSLVDRLTIIHLPDVEVRQDGDVVRVELPGDKLFRADTAQLQPDAALLIESVVADLLASYPDQMIGIEGHTDTDPVRTPRFPSNQHLSIARAMAVYDQLTGPLRVRPAQLFVMGHGPNHPVVSNATAAGKARNRRIELVIYPEKAGAGR